jgi:energy-coupling factor transporter ATP-binding protein EcfA2
MHDEAIRFAHVSFTYAGQEEPALDDVSLHVPRGQMVVIMGATGAGKSTLAKCLNRTVPIFQPGRLSGEIALLGTTVDNQTVADLAGTIGVVSQDFEAQLFATNVQQEVAFGMEQLGVAPSEMGRRLSWALAKVGLQGFESRDPSTLSGGEKQRLAIAATLALEPQILVFDEPTTDLDPMGRMEIFAVLAAMRQHGYTLVVIEHEVAAAELADRVLVISRGRVVADDAPARVLGRVEFLDRHGVRPPDLARLANRLGWPSPLPFDAAVTTLRPRIRSHASTAVPPLEPGASNLAPALVNVQQAEFAYESGTTTLAGVSLTIRGGDFLAIIGQNGSGKTTLAKLLNGLLRPQRGSVLLQGTDVGTLPLDRVAADVGYVFQNPDHQIFAATVLEEVSFGPRNLKLLEGEVERRVAAALDAVGLTGCEDEDPFLLGKGQRQRLAVASLLALHPKLLILDEPTTGLDYLEQRRMMELIAQLHRGGMTVAMITHSPWVVAEYATRAVLMHQGRILFDGPLRGLFADEALMARARFHAPEITRLGRRLGVTPLSVAELVAEVAPTSAQPLP